MALIAIASDKGAPGVTTAALALAAVWPRPVLLAECDAAGGDLVYRFPAAGGGHLDPRRGVLSLAVVARRGMQPQQVWEHVQKLHGGLDVLAGVTNAEQGAGLSLLWGPIGKALASLPQADVIADCGRLGADGPLYDLLAEATTVVLVTKVHVADVIRLRDRAIAFAAAARSRGRRGFGVGVVVVADHKKFRASLGEVQHVLGQANAPATVLGGIAHDTKGADLLSGEWGGSLDRTMLIKTAREVARHLAQGLPPIGNPVRSTGPQPALPQPAGPQPAGPQPAGPQPAGPQPAGPQPAYQQPAYQQAAHQQAAHQQPAYPPPPAPAPAPATPASAAASAVAPPTVSATAPRTTFSRVRGRHQAGPAQAAGGAAQPPAAVNGTQAGAQAGAHAAAHAMPEPGQAPPRPPARHASAQPQAPAQAQAQAQETARPAAAPGAAAYGGSARSVFSRAPMTPLMPVAPTPAPAPSPSPTSAPPPALALNGQAYAGAETAGPGDHPEPGPSGDSGWGPPWQQAPSQPGGG